MFEIILDVEFLAVYSVPTKFFGSVYFPCQKLAPWPPLPPFPDPPLAPKLDPPKPPLPPIPPLCFFSEPLPPAKADDWPSRGLFFSQVESRLNSLASTGWPW